MNTQTINLTIGNRTYHYGSARAYEVDMQRRRYNARQLVVNAKLPGVGKERVVELFAMQAHQTALIEALADAYKEECQRVMTAMREFYKAQE